MAGMRLDGRRSRKQSREGCGGGYVDRRVQQRMRALPRLAQRGSNAAVSTHVDAVPSEFECIVSTRGSVPSSRSCRRCQDVGERSRAHR